MCSTTIVNLYNSVENHVVRRDSGGDRGGGSTFRIPWGPNQCGILNLKFNFLFINAKKPS